MFLFLILIDLIAKAKSNIDLILMHQLNTFLLETFLKVFDSCEIFSLKVGQKKKKQFILHLTENLKFSTYSYL